MQSVRTPRAMKETVKTRPSREYGVLQHSAILKTWREERGVNNSYKMGQIKTNLPFYTPSKSTINC